MISGGLQSLILRDTALVANRFSAFFLMHLVLVAIAILSLIELYTRGDTLAAVLFLLSILSGTLLFIVRHSPEGIEKKQYAGQIPEEKYSQIFNQMHDGYALHEIICDENGAPCDYRFLDVNPSFEKMTGISRNDAVGKTVLDVFPHTEKHWIKTYGKVALARTPIEFKDYSSDLDKHFHVKAFSPEPGQFAVVFTDITEHIHTVNALKENEARFKRLFENAPLGYQSLDENGAFVEVNQAWLDMFGFEHDEVIGHKCQDFLIEENFIETNFPHFKDQGAIQLPFTNMRCKDGKTKIIHVDGRIGYDAEGQFIQTHCILTDVTTQIETTKSLLKAKEDAETANNIKSDFLAAMSHELRTPLNAVLGFAQLLQYDSKNPLTETQASYVDNIMSGGAHLLSLVNDILDLTKIEADRLALSLENLVANKIVTECVQLAENIGAPNQIRIINNFKNHDAVMLNTDPLRLRQVLVNLLSNAIKFNRTSGTVTVDGSETNKGFLRISVHDTGIGIQEEDREKVFQAFRRIQSDALIAHDGTGIGLTVSQLLVERMGGRIGFESEVGIGSTFWVELPLASNDTILIWSESFRIGIDALDKDHQVLITLLNRVTHHYIDHEDIDDIIRELQDYADYHFAREEAIMKACECPDFNTHQHQHKVLKDDLDDLILAWQKTRNRKTVQGLQSFLRNWLSDHILYSDVKIRRYIKGKERQIQAALNEFEKNNHKIGLS